MTDDPYDPDNPDYQKFLESCAEQCRCKYDCPCAGTLAGGMCDGLDEEFYRQFEEDGREDVYWDDFSA